MSRFLRFCAILSVFLFSSNAFAGGYYCAIEYTSCAANYYLSNNSCKACSSVSFTDTDYEACTITNGTGTLEATRTCYRTTSSAGSTLPSACTGSANCGSYTYGTCTVETCNTHYHANAANTGCVGDEYTITLNANGGSGGTTAIYTRYNTGVYLDSARTKQMTTLTTSYAITKPTRAGYTFKGYASSNGATMYIGENGILAFNGLTAGRTATSNLTWYAVWDCNTTCGEKANTTSTQSCSLNCTIDHGTCTYTGCSQTCNGNYTNSSACSSAGATCTGCSSWGACGGCTKNITCNPGFYLSNGACMPCGGSGFYCPGDNSRHQVETGFYSTGGSDTTTRTGQTKCEPGNYCSGGVKYACGGGKWSNEGATSCSSITAGCYGTSASSACPAKCEGNNYSYEGAASCSSCPNSPSGYWDVNGNGLHDTVKECYKNVPWTVGKGEGTQNCYYTSGSGSSAVYAGNDIAGCDTQVVTSCTTGYHIEGQLCANNKYTVKFWNSAGTDSSMGTQNFTYDVPQHLKKNTYTNGVSKFVGWATSYGSTTVRYDQEEYVSNLTTTNGATVNLYAVWGTCTPCSGNTGANCTLSAPAGECTYTTSCKGGYYNISNNGKYNATCSPVGDAYWSPDKDNSRYACTIATGWTTSTGTTTASAYTSCYQTQTPSGCSSGTIKRTASGLSGTTVSYNSTPTVNSTLSAPVNSYVNGTECRTCPSEYPNSDGGNISASYCWKSCTKACTQQTCPANATCTHGTTSTSGKEYYGGTCNAAASTCSLSFTCNAGYSKNANGTACEPITVDCPAGQFMWWWGGKTTCEACHAGYYCPGGTNVYGSGDVGVQNSAGVMPIAKCSISLGTGYTSEIGQSAATDCYLPVDGGYIRVNDSGNPSTAGTKVAACAAGKYKTAHKAYYGTSYACSNVKADHYNTGCGTDDIGGVCSGSYSGGACATNASSLAGASYCICDLGYSIGGGSSTTSYSTTDRSGSTCALKTYTITLDKNGGSGTMASSVTCTHGQSCTLPSYSSSSTIAKSNQVFVGWSTSSSATSASYTTSGTFTAATTLYAVWETCTACSGNMGVNCSVSVSNNKCVYTTSCKGGFYNISNNGKYNATCSVVSNGYWSGDGDNSRYQCTATTGWTTATGTLTASSYTSCYQTQTPSGCSSGTIKRTASGLSGTTVSYGTATVTSTLSAPANSYVDGTACQTCPSEYPNSDGGNISDSYCWKSCSTGYSGRDYNGATDTCSKNNYTITVSKNGGSGNLIVNGVRATGTNSVSVTCAYGDTITLPAWNGLTNALTKSNSVFTGWSSSSVTCDGNKTVTAQWGTCSCTKGSNVSACSATGVSGNKCAYNFTCNSYYNYSGSGTGTFSGNAGVAANTSPNCSANTCTVKYDCDTERTGSTGGEILEFDVSEGLPLAFEVCDIHAGWNDTDYWDRYTDDTYTQLETSRYANEEDTLICEHDGDTFYLRAEQTPIEYTVTYSCGDGTGTAPAQATATYDSNFTPAANTCSREGYEFDGWSVSGTSDVRAAGTAFKWEYAANKTFTAKWTAKCNKITLDSTLLGGSGGTAAVWKKTDSTTYYSNSTCSSSPITTVSKPSKTNATYLGYYLEDSILTGADQCVDANGALSTESHCNVTGDVTWYAHYYCNEHYRGETNIGYGACVGNSYSVNLDKNASTATAGDTAVYTVYNTAVYADSAHSKQMTTSANPITRPGRPGYIFKGYYSAQSGGTQYIDSTGKITTSGLNVAKAVTNTTTTWYAQWNPCAATHYCPGNNSGIQINEGYYGDNCYNSGNASNPACAVQTICPAGSYCTGGVKTLCPAGQYGATTGLKTSTCSGSCTAGYYCPAGSTSSKARDCDTGTTTESSANVWTSKAGAGARHNCYREITLNKNGAKGTISTSGLMNNANDTVVTATGTDSLRMKCFYGVADDGSNMPCYFPSTSTLSLTGYDISGWGTSVNSFGSSCVNSANITSTASGLTYYACKSAKTNEFTVNWDENGGESIANTTCEYGTNLELPAAPSYDSCHQFVGWKMPDGTIRNPGYKVIGGCVIGIADENIQAQWKNICGSGGYTCNMTNKYTSCNSGFYLSNCTSSGTYNGQELYNGGSATGVWGNACSTCPTGYSCAGGSTCPAPNTNTKYVVNHYIKNLGATTYTLNSTDNKTGTTHASVTLANLKKDITGFTYNKGFAGTSTKGTTMPSSGAVTTAIILADGTRVIDLYYTRVITTITIDKNGGSGSLTVNGVDETDTTDVSFTCEYGASFTLPAWDGSNNALAQTNKVFTGWSKASPVTCGTADQTITAQWTTPTCTAGTGVNTTSLNKVTNNAPVCKRSSKDGYYCSATQTGTAGATSLEVSCSPAGDGYYAKAGATDHTACAQGSYSEKTSASTKCLACPKGRTTSSTGTHYNATANTACSVTCSNASNAKSWADPSWSANTVTNLCTVSACNANTYYTAENGTGYKNTCSPCGSNSSTSDGNTSETCTCAPGHTNDGTVNGGSTSKTGCTRIAGIECASGQYLPGKATTCSACRAGNHCPSSTKTYSYNDNDQGITPCDEGTYQPDTGKTSCKEADMGYHVPSEGAVVQSPCTGITYADETGLTECKVCPTVTNNTANATTSYDYWNTGEVGDHTTVKGCNVKFTNVAATHGSMSELRCYADADAATSGEYGVDGTSKGCWVYWDKLTCDGGYYNANYSENSNYDFTNKTLSALKQNACVDVTSGYWSADDVLTREECPNGYSSGSDNGRDSEKSCYANITLNKNGFSGKLVSGTGCPVSGTTGTTNDTLKLYYNTACTLPTTSLTQTGYTATTGWAVSNTLGATAVTTIAASTSAPSVKTYYARKTTCAASYYKSANTTCSACSGLTTGGFYSKSSAGTASDNSVCFGTLTKGTYVAEAKTDPVSCEGGYCDSTADIYYGQTGGRSTLANWTCPGGADAASDCYRGVTLNKNGMSGALALPTESGCHSIGGTTGANNDTVYVYYNKACKLPTTALSATATGTTYTGTKTWATSANAASGFVSSITLTDTSSTTPVRYAGKMYTCSEGYYLKANTNGACTACSSPYYCEGITNKYYSANDQGRSACADLDSAKKDGTYTSVSPYNAATTCRFTQEQQPVTAYCATKTSNTMSYNSDGWPANTYKVTALPGSVIVNNNKASAACSQCTGATYSAGGTATTCSACDSNYTYNTDAGKSLATQCQTSCAPGQYVESIGGVCVNVGPGFWGAGGTVAYGSTSGRTACSSGLTTIGYGVGANEEADCGRILHAGANQIYLRSAKRTSPAFHALVDGKTYYGNMVERTAAITGALMVRDKDGKLYSVENDNQ